MITANWENIRQYERIILGLAKFSSRVEKALDDLLHALTEEAAQNLKGAILNNRPELIGKKRFRAISVAWRKKKARMGWATTPLNRTGSYARAIYTEHSGGQHKILLPQGPYDDGAETYNFTWEDLARWLENGTRRFRPIKHWRPTKEWIIVQFRQRMRKAVINALFRG